MTTINNDKDLYVPDFYEESKKLLYWRLKQKNAPITQDIYNEWIVYYLDWRRRMNVFIRNYTRSLAGNKEYPTENPYGDPDNNLITEPTIEYDTEDNLIQSIDIEDKLSELDQQDQIIVKLLLDGWERQHIAEYLDMSTSTLRKLINLIKDKLPQDMFQ